MQIVLLLMATLLWQHALSLNQGIDTNHASTKVAASLMKDLPAWYQLEKQYRVDPYIRVAVKLQAMGKKEGSALLLRMAHFGREEPRQRREATLVLARMLFVPKQGIEFRRLLLGAPGFIALSPAQREWPAIIKNWPLEPIALVDGIPFLIVTGYNLSGEPEDPESYVRYCMENCDWNDYRFKTKSKEEKQKAVEKLLASFQQKKLDILNGGEDALRRQIQ